MDSPATCERIRLACSDQFTQLVGNVYTYVYHCRVILITSRTCARGKAISFVVVVICCPHKIARSQDVDVLASDQ